MHITGQVPYNKDCFVLSLLPVFCLFLLPKILKIDAKKRGTPTMRNVGVESQLLSRQLLLSTVITSLLFFAFFCLLRLIKYFSFHPRWCQPREKMHRGLEQHRSCPNSKSVAAVTRACPLRVNSTRGRRKRTEGLVPAATRHTANGCEPSRPTLLYSRSLLPHFCVHITVYAKRD
jgi:hypothetical protein